MPTTPLVLLALRMMAYWIMQRRVYTVRWRSQVFHTLMRDPRLTPRLLDVPDPVLEVAIVVDPLPMFFMLCHLLRMVGAIGLFPLRERDLRQTHLLALVGTRVRRIMELVHLHGARVRRIMVRVDLHGGIVLRDM